MPDTTIEEYLDDGLYIRWDGNGAWLLADSLYDPSNRVYLEPEVWASLQKFMERVKA